MKAFGFDRSAVADAVGVSGTGQEQEEVRERRRFDRERFLRRWSEWLAIDTTRQALLPFTTLLVLAMVGGWWFGSQHSVRQQVVDPGVQRTLP